MRPNFNRYIEEIVQQTDATEEEKDDLREELLIHLELSYADKRKEGHSEKESKQLVLESFGMSGKIGSQIQQAMFPYRKEMMGALAVLSLLFSVAIYVSKLFVEADAHMFWLTSSVLVSASLLIFTLHPIPLFNRRLWMNTLLLIHIFIFLYGMLLATSLDSAFSTILTVYSLIILLFAIALIYRTTIVDVQTSKSVKIFHMLNMTSGIFIIALTLFFIWAMLAFDFFKFNRNFFISFAPFFIWLIAYIMGGQFIKRQRKVLAYSISAVPIFICLYSYIFWFT